MKTCLSVENFRRTLDATSIVQEKNYYGLIILSGRPYRVDLQGLDERRSLWVKNYFVNPVIVYSDIFEVENVISFL